MGFSISTTEALIFLVMLLLWLLPSVVIGRWGVSKGKSFWEGFLLSVFVSPMVGAIVIGLSTSSSGVQARIPRY